MFDQFHSAPAQRTLHRHQAELRAPVGFIDNVDAPAVKIGILVLFCKVEMEPCLSNL